MIALQLLGTFSAWANRRQGSVIAPIKRECLDRMVFVGQASLERAVAAHVVPYNSGRGHQGHHRGVSRAQRIGFSETGQ